MRTRAANRRVFCRRRPPPRRASSQRPHGARAGRGEGETPLGQRSLPDRRDRHALPGVGHRREGPGPRRRRGHLRRRSPRPRAGPGAVSAARRRSTKTTASCSIARTSTWCTIGTPDHWHTKMVDRRLPGRQGRLLREAADADDRRGQAARARSSSETGRVVQVGSWQRSDHRFRLAVEMVRQGRIGKLQRVEVVLGKNVDRRAVSSRASPPPQLNWDLWQGQTPDVPVHRTSAATTRSAGGTNTPAAR